MEVFIIVSLILAGTTSLYCRGFPYSRHQYSRNSINHLPAICQLLRFRHIRTDSRIHYFDSIRPKLHSHYRLVYALKTMDKLSLKKTLDYKIDPLKGTHIRIGDKGIAITRLALIGNANFNGHIIIEVRSADGLIDENTPIYVERMVEGTVIVRKFNQ